MNSRLMTDEWKWITVQKKEPQIANKTSKSSKRYSHIVGFNIKITYFNTIQTISHLDYSVTAVSYTHLGFKMDCIMNWLMVNDKE